MQLFSSSNFNMKTLVAFASILLISGISLFGNSALAQAYCTPSYFNSCSSVFINDFSLNTLSKKNSGCNGNPNNYIHDLSVTTSLEKGGAYSISMQSDPVNPQGFGVWIDYNQNGNFSEANEFVYASPTFSKDVFSAYILIPSAAATGPTRLRLRSNYYTTVTSNESCASFSYGEAEDYTITIVQPPACVNPPVAGTAVASKTFLCSPNETFYLSLNGNPNGTGQTYQWQQSTNGINWSTMFGSTTKAISPTISQSTYFRCLVTCSGTSISTPVLVSVTAPLTLNFNSTDVSCYGKNDGAITATLTGGTSPYTYAWSHSTGSPTPPPRIYPNAPMLDSLYTATYNVIVTDVKGCMINGSQWINQPNQIFLSPSTINSSCGSPTGSAWVTVLFGGTLPYSYLWQGGQTNDTITAIGSGIYEVTVTDGNNCISSVSIPVSDFGGPTLTFNTTMVSCHGGNNGSASFTTSGGTPPFSYYWNTIPQQTTSNATGLSGETYFVTVSDLSGCKFIGNTTVPQPVMLTSGAQSNSVTCIGTCNGSINTNVQGGTWPYSYSWSNSETTTFIDTLCAGNYSLTITDGNGCTLVETHTVAQPVPLTANTVKKDVSCFGASNGLIGVLPSGGKSPYNFNWSPLNVVGDTATGLSPGTYSVIVTDSDTCNASYTAFATIIQPAAITTTLTSTNTTCNGACTGSASATPSGGIGPYTYLWVSTAQATQTASFLCAGTHTVLVSDNNNCEKTDVISVGQPVAVPITVAITPTSCGSQSGTASASVTGAGAIPPFSYLWTTGSTASAINGLEAGIYRANVTDGNGCFGFADAMVTSSNGPVITTNSVTHVTCFGLSNGAINISVSGGGAPYTFFWSNGQTTEDISNLSYGPYEVNVTNATGCMVMKSIFVNEPAHLSWTPTIINSGCGVNNGYASVTMTGGTSPYTYLWSIGGTTNAKAGLGAGAYEIKVTDSKGCKDSTLIAVQDSGGPVVFVDTIAAANCGSNGYVLLVPQDSTAISGYNWTTGSTSQNLTGVNPGNYGVVITDNSGCKSTLIAPVNPALPPLKPICLVTVDTLTNENLIVWEKPVSTFIAGFNIYRESSQQGIYQKIAYSPYANESSYYDKVPDPDKKWSRYKISMKDICGTEGPLSPDHKTMHVSIQSATANTTTLIWDAHVGYPFSHYNIVRKDSINGIWTVIGAMPASINTYTDFAFPSTGAKIYYHVHVDHPGGDCVANIKNPEPQATTVTSGKSNSSDRLTNPPSSVSEISAENWIALYPNPNHGLFTIELKNNSSSLIKIFNVLGEEVKRVDCGSNKNKVEVDMRKQARGVYYVQVSSDERIITKKIVIE